MSNKAKPNPWKQNNSNQKQKKVLKDSTNVGPGLSATAEHKFKEAQAKLQNAVKKHIKDYESSSDEEDIDSTDLIESILKQYSKTGGTNDQILKTQTFIEESVLSGAITCLICISRIKRDDQIWTCNNCFGGFHLNCIQRWSKDTVIQLKQRIEDQTLSTVKSLFWCCPKCRYEYNPNQIPDKYVCFCGRSENPKYQPFLVPHSCGELCQKELIPRCGHKCLLLCHPGPCPPCPVTVNVSCYCGSNEPVTKRCSLRGWSCGKPCAKTLSCNKHACREPCHEGTCKDCLKKSIQKCMCGGQQKLRDCNSPIWQCDKVCEKPLDCGKHKCENVCHAGVCDTCPLTKPRTCPCGKTKYQLPCTESTPTCPDTCGKLLECGIHTCNFRCHKDKCGLCLEMVTKACRCHHHFKEIQCCKQYLCETKCKKLKDCNKHPCNRKCCDGNCPPCEKPCGQTLQCGNHKCPSVCHRGPCFPCQQTNTLSCRCGGTKITVPCGKRHKVKPPKCTKPCKIPPNCHHQKRDNHKCHFGDCPSCRQTCKKSRSSCSHLCTAVCHSSVVVKIEAQKATMPWEQTSPQFERKCLPCPDCKEPVMVTCLGEHETSPWPCHLAKPSNCGRPCGRILRCTNHTCSLSCHVVECTSDKLLAGSNCESCENPCSKPRPEGCAHSCPKPCHPDACPPCKQMLRIKCHCGLTQPYVPCSSWQDVEKREELQSCGNQCPKNYPCGHRCKSNCHSGQCPNPESCKKKMKITCNCKRLKKEFQCEAIRNGLAKAECDEVCKEKQEEGRKKRQADEAIRLKEQELKNKKELEEYEKKLIGKKKSKGKRINEEVEESSFIGKYWIVILSVFLVVTSVVIYQALS
ncbi:NF-X1-type zinc finger protein NFXL1 isoform X2 [Sitophilus oryzae]|nr:NF-X1-type zinc finger protein NFXL1 isoform X2 [Sitophilus oryzae]XP_030765607.1 NF-X1-type zinc finger protein NFXL1 isoform X2 [Sitophilus oryzae]